MAYGDLTVRQEIDCGPVGGVDIWQAGSRWFGHIEDGEWDVLVSGPDRAQVETAGDDLERFAHLSGQDLPMRPLRVFQREVARAKIDSGVLIATSALSYQPCADDCQFVYIYELVEGVLTNIAGYPRSRCEVVQEDAFTFATPPRRGNIEVNYGDGLVRLPLQSGESFLTIKPVQGVQVNDFEQDKPPRVDEFKADGRGGLGSFLPEPQQHVTQVATTSCTAPVSKNPNFAVRSPAVCLDDFPFGPVTISISDRLGSSPPCSLRVRFRSTLGFRQPCAEGVSGAIGEDSLSGYQRTAILAPEAATEVTVITRSGFAITSPVFESLAYAYWATSQGTLGWLEATTPNGPVTFDDFWQNS